MLTKKLRARAHRPGIRLAGAGATLGLATMALAGPSSAAAAPSFTCSASVISGSLLGTPLPISEIPNGPCVTRTAPGVTLPPPLSASLLTAATQADAGKAIASSSVANVDLGLGNVPLALDKLVAGIAPIVIPLPPALKLLGLPPQISIDVRQAVAAALPNGKLPLSILKLGAVQSLAGATCQPDGTLVTGAQSRVADLSVLGVTIDTGKAVDQSVPLLDTTNVNLANLDLTKVLITTPGINLGLPGVQALLTNTIKGLLTSLPPIKIPASVLQVKLSLAEATHDATSAAASGVHLSVSLAGRPVVDLVISGSKVAASSANDCPKPAVVVAQSKPAALQCTDRRIVLEDVLLTGDKVHLRGFTTRQNAGQRVTLRFLAGGRMLARPVVQPDGSFAATVPAPPRALIGTNRARYRALIGKYQSFGLKLTRRLQFTKLGAQGTNVSFAGRIVRPAPGQLLDVRQRITCTRWVVIRRVRVPASGLVQLTVPKPTKGTEAVYRLVTLVRHSDTGSRKLFQTFTTPQSVKLR